MHWKQQLLLIVTLTFFTGCHTSDELNLDYRINSSRNTNPSKFEPAQPVVIYLYELRSGTIFNQLDFFSLTENPSKQLGNDFINEDQIEIQAATQLSSRIKLSKDTRYIGIIAGFRHLNDGVWRRLLVVPTKKFSHTVSLDIHLSSNTLTATIR